MPNVFFFFRMKLFIVAVALIASTSAFPSFGDMGDFGGMANFGNINLKKMIKGCDVKYKDGSTETRNCSSPIPNFLTCQKLDIEQARESFERQLRPMFDSMVELLPDMWHGLLNMMYPMLSNMIRRMVDEYIAEVDELSLCMPVS